MRILRVKGAGLASLAAEFDLDFADAGLRDAGVFMICGATGAGKSTILDAIMLALFDTLPRTEIGLADRTITLTGAAARDRTESTHASASILSRGVGSAYAQVDFVGIDGCTYRARWEVRRARNKAAGSLQKTDMTLMRLGSDGIARGLGGTKTETLGEIQYALGLSAAQFTRTALLAQNRFDAFLTADEPSRAELLEKITGEDVYARISQRIHQITAAKRAELRSLDSQVAQIAVLSDDMRAVIEAEKDQLTRALASCRERSRHLEQAAHWWRVRSDLEQAVGATLRDLAASEEQLAGLSGLREELGRARAAIEIVPLLTEAQTAHTCLVDAAMAHRAAMKAVDDNDIATTAASETLTAAQAAVVEGETKSALFAPLWLRAGDLDRQLERAAVDAVQAEARAHATGGACRAGEKALAELRAQHVDLTARRAAAKRDALMFADAAPALDRGGDIAIRLAAHTGVTAELAEVDARLARLQAVDSAAMGACVAATAALAVATSDRTRIETEHAALAARHDPDMMADVRRRQRDMLQKRVSLTRLATLAHDARQCCSAGAAATTDSARLTSDLAAAQATLEQGARELPLLTARIEEAKAAEQAFALALGQPAARLRAALRDGEPCPVCGSPDHPLHDSDLAAAVAAQRDRVAALELERRALCDRADTARVVSDHAARAIQAAGQVLAGTAARLDMLQREWTIERERLAKAHSSRWSLPADPWTDDARDGVAALETEFQQLLVTIDTRVEELDVQARAVAASEAATRQCRTLEDSAREALRVAEQNRATATTALAVLTSEQQALTRRRDAEEVALAPVLSGLGLAVAALRTDGAAVARIIDERTGALAHARVRSISTERGLADLSPRIAAAEADLLHLSGAAAAARAEVANCTVRSTDLASARSALLGGEATDSHRSRHATDLSAARLALETAQARLQERHVGQAGAVAALAGYAATVSAASLRAELALGHSEAALAQAALTQEQAAALIARGASFVTKAETTIRSAENAVVGDRHAHHGATNRLADHLASEVPDQSAAEIDVERGLLAKQRDGGNTRLGTLLATLEQNAEACGRRADLTTIIAAARVDLDVWLAVDEAVGSPDGSKFRRFAQAHTFVALIELANEQLRLLAPRYKLAPTPGTLSLQVVDQDMGGEVRGVRSLSGGERFLISLALALALSTLGSGKALIETLFIDEGFGALDPESLDFVLDGLDALRAQGRTVCVISHVEAMKERFPVQILVEKRGGGRSTVRISKAAA